MHEKVLQILDGLRGGNFLSIARAISIVENDHFLAEEVLSCLLPNQEIPIIGITGSPGSGKSTLLSALTAEFVAAGKKVAILAIDPSSPFNDGSLLGDRIRMVEHYNQPGVYIRSLSNRGVLGGLAEKTIEISDVLRSSVFDIILVETVGVGQSEIDIVSLADLTIVVLIPESGDEIQHVKSGLMEIADIFVVNKVDRDVAGIFARNLKRTMLQNNINLPVISTVATEAKGIDNLIKVLIGMRNVKKDLLKLNTEKAWRLIRKRRMKDINKEVLMEEINELSKNIHFNLYKYIQQNY